MINGPIWDESKLDAGEVPTILAVGDSWFWYPRNNLAIPLHRILNRRQDHIILVRGHNGAEAIEYAQGPVRDQIERDLDRRHGWGRTLKAVFLSGGGNDFAGKDDLPSVLKGDCTGIGRGEDCFQPGEPDALLGTVCDALGEVARAVAARLPGAPILVHGYDYPDPSGKGFLGLGQWLQYPMDQCKVRRGVQPKVVKHLIDRLNDVLVNRLAADNPGLPIHVVNLRDTLVAEEWANELHPTPAGFNKLAKVWKPTLENLGLA